MIADSRKRLVVVLASMCVVLWLSAAGSSAVAAETAEAKPAAEKKAPAKPRGRLPMYYSAVVSPQQREQIYAIQAKYAPQIEELEKQFEALKKQRDAEVEAVLAPEQQAKVKEARLAAEAKRKQAAQPKAAKEETSAEP